MTWVHVLLLLMAVGGAVGLVRLLDRRNRHEIVAAYGMPTSLNLDDFPELAGAPAIVLFSHDDCRACGAARRLAGSQTVKLIEADGTADPQLLKRYGIDGVPTTLVVETGGAVVAGWVGPLDPRSLKRAIEDIAEG